MRVWCRCDVVLGVLWHMVAHQPTGCLCLLAAAEELQAPVYVDLCLVGCRCVRGVGVMLSQVWCLYTSQTVHRHVSQCSALFMSESSRIGVVWDQLCCACRVYCHYRALL